MSAFNKQVCSSSMVGVSVIDGCKHACHCLQFWSIKARCMDLVLFCRHGSFYNL